MERPAWEDPNEKGCLICVVGVLGGGILIFLLMAFSLHAEAIFTLAFHLFAGPWFYLGRVLPEMRPKLDALLTAVVCVALLAIAAHVFFGWLYRSWGPSGEAVPPRVWKKRWTACFVAGLLVLFSAGIAAIGVVHQTGWLLRSPIPPYTIERGLKPSFPPPTQATPTASRP